MFNSKFFFWNIVSSSMIVHVVTHVLLTKNVFIWNNYTCPLYTYLDTQTDDKKYKLLLTRPATTLGAKNGVHSPAFKVDYPALDRYRDLT